MLGLSMGCGSSTTVNGKHLDTLGLFTLDEKEPGVCYTVIAGNVVWSVLLFETLFMPVYFVGFSIIEPTDRDFCHKEA
jgi:hypothetical protein